MANKSRLIDANEAKRRIIAFATGCHSEVLAVDSLIMMLNQSDTVDAVEVVHGRWEYNPGNPSPYCSHCGNEPDNHGRETPFCPLCGARMDLKEADHA